MNQPLRWICVGVLTGLCVLSGPTLAADAADPTAAELYTQFNDQYTRGDYQEA